MILSSLFQERIWKNKKFFKWRSTKKPTVKKNATYFWYGTLVPFFRFCIKLLLSQDQTYSGRLLWNATERRRGQKERKYFKKLVQRSVAIKKFLFFHLNILYVLFNFMDMSLVSCVQPAALSLALNETPEVRVIHTKACLQECTDSHFSAVGTAQRCSVTTQTWFFNTIALSHHCASMDLPSRKRNCKRIDEHTTEGQSYLTTKRIENLPTNFSCMDEAMICDDSVK